MLPAFVIGLREDLETVVILGAIALFLIHNDRHDRLRTVWIASGEATALCLAAADYGRLALVASDEPSGPRTMAPTSFDRVDIEGDVGLCLKPPASGLDISTAATVFDAHLKHYGLLQDQAIASRNPLSRATRASPTGRLSAPIPGASRPTATQRRGCSIPGVVGGRHRQIESDRLGTRICASSKRSSAHLSTPPPEPGFPPKSHPWAGTRESRRSFAQARGRK
jgi:hypothetical protein